MISEQPDFEGFRLITDDEVIEAHHIQAINDGGGGFRGADKTNPARVGHTRADLLRKGRTVPVQAGHFHRDLRARRLSGERRG